MKQHLLLLSGAVLVAGAVLIAQQPAAPPQAGGPGAGRGAGGRGPAQYQLEKGKPIDTRALPLVVARHLAETPARRLKPTITPCGKAKRTPPMNRAAWPTP